jgi:hypothetical protein
VNPPAPQLPPDVGQHLGDVLEYAAKAAVSVGALWAFIAKIAKPFVEWRRHRLTVAIRAALGPELKMVAEIKASEEERGELVKLALERQSQLFSEMELFLVVVAEARDRLDDFSALLDEVGFSSRNRRAETTGDRRRMSDEAMAQLQGIVRMRRRRADDLPNVEGSNDPH